MHTLSFDTIYSSFLLLVESFQYVEYTEDELHEEFLSLLKLSLGKPYIRSIFRSVSLDEYINEMEFEMKSDDTDSTEADHYVTYILAMQMAILWLEPQINSMTYTKMLLSGKEEKFYSQANALKELTARSKEMKLSLKKEIRDRGYTHNSYISGNAD